MLETDHLATGYLELDIFFLIFLPLNIEKNAALEIWGQKNRSPALPRPAVRPGAGTFCRAPHGPEKTLDLSLLTDRKT